MGRLGLRLLMGAVGVGLLALYALGAWFVYAVLVAVWANRPPLGTSLLIVAVTTLVIGYLSYQFGTTRLLASLDAVEIPRRQAPDLYDRVDAIAARMDLKPPRLLVAEMSVPNALALGSANKGVVVLDRSLLQFLRAAELEGIVAHELAHVESRDSLVQTLAYSAMRTVVGLLTVALLPGFLFLTGLARSLAWIRGRPTRWTESGIGRFQQWLGGAVALVFVLLTLVIRAHSRRREFAADDRAATVTGDPVALARALAKIERVSDPHWGLLSPLYVRGDQEGSLGRVFSTHPDTDDRIQRLLERAADRQ